MHGHVTEWCTSTDTTRVYHSIMMNVTWTAFRPISEAARSWSCDKSYCLNFVVCTLQCVIFCSFYSIKFSSFLSLFLWKSRILWKVSSKLELNHSPFYFVFKHCRNKTLNISTCFMIPITSPTVVTISTITSGFSWANARKARAKLCDLAALQFPGDGSGRLPSPHPRQLCFL